MRGYCHLELQLRRSGAVSVFDLFFLPWGAPHFDSCGATSSDAAQFEVQSQNNQNKFTVL